MPNKDIHPTYQLSEAYFYIHKTKLSEKGFGLDNTTKLIENSFGIYSCENLQNEIGPLKSNFYRIAFCFSGSLKVKIGLEDFIHAKNTIHFSTPGRLFRFYGRSGNLQAYYLMFTKEFLEDILPERELLLLYPFFDFLKKPFLALAPQEARNIKNLMIDISNEIQNGLPDSIRKIKLLLNIILIESKRSYTRQEIFENKNAAATSALTEKFKKLVAQLFISIRTVQEYADKMAVSINHLHKIIKEETGKSAGALIDEMLIMEIKALLRYSDLNISEIVDQLNFTDNSHLSKFFKRYAGISPTEFRKLKRQK